MTKLPHRLFLALTLALYACASDPVSLVCGANTREEMGMCLASAPITCGPGTSLEDGECVAEAVGVTCGVGTVERGNECVVVDSIHLHLPFASGTQVRVSQGAHGNFSHNGTQVHAIDFTTPVGTPIVAASAGRVVSVREDSNTGCGDISCVNDGNYVIVDHGDGTRVQYYHLQQNGALVDVGDVVCAGEPIGLSGNTGFSSEPHLHLDVIDFYGYSLPIFFEEVGEMGDGVVFAGIDITSMNEAPATCDVEPEYSSCPADLFAVFGVWLDAGLPCTKMMRDTEYTFTGHTEGPTDKVLLALYSPGADWTYSCIDANDDGDFTGTLRFPSSSFGDVAYFVLLAADGSCRSYTGWDASVRLQLQ